jgi:peptidoglycan hydrolase-like protein with peptidoglycan-binding domain
MRRIAVAVFTIALLSLAAAAQGPGAATTTESKPKPKVFRANKDQITLVQGKLKAASVYSGEATGKLDDATRTAVKTWQGRNGLKKTGTLNRATLEKMGIALTDSQKLIPIPESSYASADKKDTKETKRVIFRATKDQITAAQAKLKAGNMYSGESSGKLDDPTRDALKKYQEVNGLKVTRTLNQATLEKMGIELTEKQKASSTAAAASPTK